MRFLSPDRPVILGLTLIVAIVVLAFCIKRFQFSAHEGHKFLKDAQSWTTPFNFFLATMLYVGLVLFAFVVFMVSPELVAATLGVFSPEAAGWAGKGIRELAKPEKRDAAMLILTAAALAALLAFKIIPFRFAEDRIRRSLQRMASTPAKVRTTINEIITPEFDASRARQDQIIDHLSKVLGHPFDPLLLADCSGLDLIGAVRFARYHLQKKPRTI